MVRCSLDFIDFKLKINWEDNQRATIVSTYQHSGVRRKQTQVYRCRFHDDSENEVDNLDSHPLNGI